MKNVNIDLGIDQLKRVNACKSGIEFVIRNNMSDRTIIEVDGDYNEFIKWNLNLPEGTYDDIGNMLSSKDSNGFEQHYTYRWLDVDTFQITQNEKIILTAKFKVQ